MNQLTCDELTKLKNDGALVVDVRTPMEYQSSHIDGAINVPLDQLNNILSEVDSDTNILLYCRSGARSGVAAQALQQAGYKAINIGAVNSFVGCLTF